jgi:hypothetical protein
VECWQPIVSANPRGLDFIVRNGIKGVTGGGAASGGLASSTLLAWQQALARDGRSAEPGADLVVGLMKMLAPLGLVPGLTDEQIAAIAVPTRTRQTQLPTLAAASRTAPGWSARPSASSSACRSLRTACAGRPKSTSEGRRHAAARDPRAARAVRT